MAFFTPKSTNNAAVNNQKLTQTQETDANTKRLTPKVKGFRAQVKNLATQFCNGFNKNSANGKTAARSAHINNPSATANTVLTTASTNSSAQTQQNKTSGGDTKREIVPQTPSNTSLTKNIRPAPPMADNSDVVTLDEDKSTTSEANDSVDENTSGVSVATDQAVVSVSNSDVDTVEVDNTTANKTANATATATATATAAQAVASNEVNKSSPPQSLDATRLLKLATTNRTYENDTTVLPGQSRQAVFKESMLDAVQGKNIKTKDFGFNIKRADEKIIGMGVTEFVNSNPSLNAHPDNKIMKLFVLKEASKKNPLLKSFHAMTSSTSELDNEIKGSGFRNTIKELGCKEVAKSIVDQLNDSKNTSENSNLLDQLVLASIAHNDLSTENGFVSRGSLSSHVEKYKSNPKLETLKNHNLTGFDNLSSVLTHVGMGMRENVVGEIRAMITKLNGEENIDPQQIDTLIKKIIVTTDAQSAKALNKPDTPAKSADQANEPSLFAGLKQIASQQLDGEGNPISLTQKVKNGASLVKENLSISEDNPNTLKVLIDSATNFANQASGDNSSQLTAFKKSLEKVVIIFSDNEAIEQNWKAPDERSFLDKAKKANAIKSMPVVNQIPVVNKVLAGTSRTVQLTTAGVAGSTIQVANVTAAAGIVAGKKVAAGAEFTGRQVAAGAKATGNAVAAGAEFTGRQVAAGAKATGNAVAAGAKATGNAVTAGAKATGNAVAAGAKATGNAVAAGAKATAKGASVAGKGALVGATYALGATAVVVAAPVLLGAATVGLPAYGAYKGIKSTM